MCALALTLSLRRRLADALGKKRRGDLFPLFGSDARPRVERLLQEGIVATSR
jgi:hypothetical protein